MFRFCHTDISSLQVSYHVALHKYRTVCRTAEVVDRGPYSWFPKFLYGDRSKSVTTAASGRTRTSQPQSIADQAESISPSTSVHANSEPTPECVALSSSSLPRPPGMSAGPNFSPFEDADLHNFVNQFRRMVHQASRDTEEGLVHASPDSSEDNGQGYPEGDQCEFDPYAEGNLLYDTNGRPIQVSVDPSQVQVFGRMVHRMPTITSIGSGERSSRAPSRAYSGYPPPGERSLPSSMSNTVENDVVGQPHSRQGVH